MIPALSRFWQTRYYVQSNKAMFSRIRQFFIDVQAEFKRIQWATRERTIRQTSIVVLVSLIIAIYLGVADLGLSNLMQLLISG